ncbi:Thiaminase [Thermomonospora echinospora]|uniref:Thiaminase n=1 Tax=Thermomonospora echinospora TaxID=1992 RepID=A0A1H6CT30_9ACTN|nr:transcriptional regulator [Thermomonospora echinospora]SEG75596.1 Thiaminase [Thermomonospora echinospora]
MGERVADELVARALRESAGRAGENRFLELLEAGAVPAERLRRLAGEEYRIVSSDRRSFALLGARFADGAAGEMFLSLAAGEGQALGLLREFAAALGMGDEELRGYEPHPFAQAYPAFLAQRAAFGTSSEVALAMLANLEEWGAYCGRAAVALRERYGLTEEAVGFFTFFAQAPPGFAEQATEVIAAGLAAGEDPDEALLAARLLHTYETAFWDSLAEGLDDVEA